HKLLSSYPLLFDERKISEIGEAVRLGPQPDLSRLGKRLVLRIEQAFAIHEDREQVVLEDDAKCAPPAARNFVLHTVSPRRKALWRDRKTRAVLNLVKHDIVLQSIRPSNVVVVRVPVTPNDTGSPIDATVHRLESDADLPVTKRRAFPDHQRKT